VLLVDDDAFIQESVGSILSHLGYDPVLASTGEEAMDKLAAHLDPILVILDMDMPGMGGASTLPLIRSLRPHLPVVIATGRLSQVAAELAEIFPLVTLMPKPYGLKELKKLFA
jgi:CheY-like chemotaxis protein